MPNPIKISSKNPYRISASKKGLTIGKWAISHLVPKSTPIQEQLNYSRKRLLKLGMEWRKLRKSNIQETPEGHRIQIEFYRFAQSYSEAHWKLCMQRIKSGKGNLDKMTKEILTTEKDFSHFWEMYNQLKNEGQTKSTNPLEQHVERIENELAETRKEYTQTENQFGVKSWQAKKSLLNHLSKYSQYLQAQSKYLDSLMRAHPESRPMLRVRIREIEEELKQALRRKQYLQDEL